LSKVDSRAVQVADADLFGQATAMLGALDCGSRGTVLRSRGVGFHGWTDPLAGLPGQVGGNFSDADDGQRVDRVSKCLAPA
jgi:hypothetical protein